MPSSSGFRTKARKGVVAGALLATVSAAGASELSDAPCRDEKSLVCALSLMERHIMALKTVVEMATVPGASRICVKSLVEILDGGEPQRTRLLRALDDDGRRGELDACKLLEAVRNG